jgi:hypothetical protein
LKLTMSLPPATPLLCNNARFKREKLIVSRRYEFEVSTYV